MVGDIIEVWFPFTDQTGGKSRPAIVLADVGMQDWVLCELTSQRLSRPGDVPVTSNDMQSGNLRRDSWARVGRLHTINDKVFNRTFGSLGNPKLSQILAAVRNLF